jgi:hypothetical protein
MPRALFGIYAALGPTVLTPAALWLWTRHFDGDVWRAAFAVGLPVAFAYVVPGIGTNLLKVWEFDVRLRLGRFRPHHGFVFGSATSLLAVAVAGPPLAHPGVAEVLSAALVMCSVLGFWNWLYDVAALRAGLLHVYNQPWSEGLGPEAVATDYAPAFFGGFGFVYGAALRLLDFLPDSQPTFLWATAFAIALAVSIGAPVTIYAACSWVRHGHSGCRPVLRSRTTP